MYIKGELRSDRKLLYRIPLRNAAEKDELAFLSVWSKLKVYWFQLTEFIHDIPFHRTVVVAYLLSWTVAGSARGDTFAMELVYFGDWTACVDFPDCYPKGHASSD